MQRKIVFTPNVAQ